MQTILIGANIEALVCAFLESNGLTFVLKNYRCRLGEIDLVMHDKISDSLVFVEVRYRANTQFGSATETVNVKKQQKLKRAVLHYLQKHCDANQRVRIDVIGVSQCDKNKESQDAEEQQKYLNQLKQNALAHSVSTHEFEGHLLRWTRNAIEE